MWNTIWNIIIEYRLEYHLKYHSANEIVFTQYLKAFYRSDSYEILKTVVQSKH